MGDGLVQVAYAHPHFVSHSFLVSLLRLVTHDQKHSGRVVRTGGPIMLGCASGALADTRNQGMRQWLDTTPHEWMFWVDTDMGFAPDTVDRLVEAADPADRPVVGGLCFAAYEDADDGMGGRRVTLVPTLYNLRRDGGAVGFAARLDVPANTVVHVAGTGAACLLVHRGAAEKVRAEHGDRWFDRMTSDRGWVSEDLSFCLRLGMLDIPTHVHTGVATTHHKQVWLGPADYSPPHAAAPPAGEVRTEEP